jgi:hypothetical protein
MPFKKLITAQSNLCAKENKSGNKIKINNSADYRQNICYSNNMYHDQLSQLESSDIKKGTGRSHLDELNALASMGTTGLDKNITPEETQSCIGI